MTAPANTQVLPFSLRVLRVRETIEQRIEEQKPLNDSELRARLWCSLLRREVLS